MRDAVTLGKIYTIDAGAGAAAESAATTWIFEHLAMALESRLPAPTRSAHLRRRLLAQWRELAPRYTRTVRADEGEWRAFAPGVRIKVLRSDATWTT